MCHVTANNSKDVYTVPYKSNKKSKSGSTTNTIDKAAKQELMLFVSCNFHILMLTMCIFLNYSSITHTRLPCLNCYIKKSMFMLIEKFIDIKSYMKHHSYVINN